jgi:hypothetical protein
MDPALHCPTCGYNLTGLPENRCPECGSFFSPAELRSLARAGFDHVSIRAMMYYLLSAPIAFWLLNTVCMQWRLPKLVGLSGMVMIAAWGLANSIHWALRTTESERQGLGRRPIGAFVRDVAAATVLQFIIGGGPCMMLVRMV